VVSQTGDATAAAHDVANTLVPNATLTWATADAGIATVIASGSTVTVTGVSVGTTSVTATAANGVVGTLTVAVSAAPSDWLVNDLFAGSDGTPLSAHAPVLNVAGHPWVLLGGSPMPTLQGGDAAVTAGSGHLQMTIDTGVADVRVGADYRVGTGPHMGALVVRATDANNHLVLLTYLGELQLYRRQAGQYTLLATHPLPPLTAGEVHRMEILATSSSVLAFWDGGMMFQINETFQQTATRHGLDWNSAFDTTTRYDNFSVKRFP
jgi:hypothetical protein